MRWRDHHRRLQRGRHYSRFLQHAWTKYGGDAFTFVVLDYVDDADGLLAAEQAWIDCRKPAYNLRAMAHSNRGMKMSAESRLRASASIRGRTHSAETKAKMSAAARGRKPSAETRATMSQERRTRVLTPEHRAKISAGLKGRVVSKENVARRRATRSKPGYGEHLSINLHSAWVKYRAPAALAAKAGWPPEVEALTSKDAAALLGCACATIRFHIHDGSLPATHGGKFWIIRRTDLAAVAPSLCARFDRFPERKNKNRPRLWRAQGDDDGALPTTQPDGV